jgi:hypothetical protein
MKDVVQAPITSSIVSSHRQLKLLKEISCP